MEEALCTPTEHLNIALINNMPDAALEDTELQFFDLLDEASGDLPIYLKLYSLTGIPRTDRDSVISTVSTTASTNFGKPNSMA